MAKTEHGKIIIASDHAGFCLKEEVRNFLAQTGWEVEDLGTRNGEESCDYPVFAFELAKKVAEGKYPFGILVCGTGVGMAIAANKVNGIRAVPCQDTIAAFLSRSHNDANVLCLGARLTTAMVGEEIVKVFLNTPFSGGRHQRRISQIVDFENQHKEG